MRKRTPNLFGNIAVVAWVPEGPSQDHEVVTEAQALLGAAGYNTTLINRHRGANEDLSLQSAMEAALECQPHGILVVCFDLDKAVLVQQVATMPRTAVPTVYVVAGELNLPLPHVFYDSRIGAFQAAQHLKDRGWLPLTVAAPFSAEWVRERIGGCCDAARHFGMASADLCVLDNPAHPWSIWEGPGEITRHLLQQAVEQGWKFTGGIVAVNDEVARGILQEAKDRGLVPGRDFALIGFDDSPPAEGEALTSLRPPLAGMAREATRMLLDELRGIDTALQVRLRAHLVARASTQPQEVASP